MTVFLRTKMAALAALAFTSAAEAASLPALPANVYHFCINRGSVTWAYSGGPSSLNPQAISPFVDFSGYSIEIRKPRILKINIRITSGGSSGSIAPFAVTYDDVAKNILMSFRASESQVAHFSQAMNSISTNNTHFGAAFTIKDSDKPLSEANITNFSLEAQTDSTGCAGFPPP